LKQGNLTKGPIGFPPVRGERAGEPLYVRRWPFCQIPWKDYRKSEHRFAASVGPAQAKGGGVPLPTVDSPCLVGKGVNPPGGFR